MSERVTEAQRRSLKRQLGHLQDAYDSPTGAPWPHRRKATDDEFDAYWNRMQYASLPRGLKVFYEATCTIKEKYPDVAERIKSETNRHDRINFCIGDIKVRGTIRGWYDYPAYEEGDMPTDVDGYQELLDYVTVAAECRLDSIKARATLEKVIDNVTSFRQIVRVIPSTLHILPDHAKADIQSAKRASRMPPNTGNITDEQIEFAETWLAKALLSKARPDWVPIDVTCTKVAE